MKIITDFDDTEPMHCQRIECEEELNGLNRNYINYGKGFIFEMWLCDNCQREFDKIIKKEKKKNE